MTDQRTLIIHSGAEVKILISLTDEKSVLENLSTVIKARLVISEEVGEDPILDIRLGSGLVITESGIEATLTGVQSELLGTAKLVAQVSVQFSDTGLWASTDYFHIEASPTISGPY